MNQTNMQLVLIDADSIIWAAAYNLAEKHPANFEDAVLAQSMCDERLGAILSNTRATHYIGAFSSSPCFRHELYKFAPYKGQRPDKPDFMQKWQRFLVDYFQDKHGFTSKEGWEADDIVSFVQEDIPNAIIASPDKDLRQSPGLYYDYAKDLLTEVSIAEALHIFYLSIVTGDSVDNIKGIPGLGPKKALELFKDCTNELEYEVVLKDVFSRHFGHYYGPIILNETYYTIKLFRKDHKYLGEPFDYKYHIRKSPVEQDVFSQALDG